MSTSYEADKLLKSAQEKIDNLIKEAKSFRKIQEKLVDASQHAYSTEFSETLIENDGKITKIIDKLRKIKKTL